MKPSRTLALVAGALASASGAAAQLQLNELNISHCGLDDMEYIELKGPPGMQLDGYMICVVEGDNFSLPPSAPAPAGLLDEVWDLSGNTIPADGYFVLGDQAVPNVDLVVGIDNIIENGTETFYLIRSTTPGLIQLLQGLDVDLDDDGITELLVGDPSVTVIEVFAVVDADFGVTDVVYDCAPVLGPNLCGGVMGPFLPAGVLRPGDSPAGWCSNAWIEFDPTSIGGACSGCPLGEARTPGTANPQTTCTTLMSGLSCNPSGPLGTSYCTPAVPNSTGQSGVTSAQGSPIANDNDVTLTASQLPAGQFGYFIGSMTQGLFNPPASSGFICLGGTIGRFNQPNLIGQGPTFSIQIDTTAIPVFPPVAINPGETWNFQAWYRDAAGTNNFTDAVAIGFL